MLSRADTTTNDKPNMNVTMTLAAMPKANIDD